VPHVLVNVRSIRFLGPGYYRGVNVGQRGFCYPAANAALAIAHQYDLLLEIARNLPLACAGTARNPCCFCVQYQGSSAIPANWQPPKATVGPLGAFADTRPVEVLICTMSGRKRAEGEEDVEDAVSVLSGFHVFSRSAIWPQKE
jgi:hypothetical protein